MMDEALMRCLIQLCAKEVIMHLYALTNFANDMRAKHPRQSDAVFSEMERPKPKNLYSLIDGAAHLLQEILLEEGSDAIQSN